MAKIVVYLINIYQNTLSPDHGALKIFYPHGFCKYHPSCSEYTKQAVQKYGVIEGLSKGFYRLLRCNPFSQGGIDLA